jgi:hypothetical protein
MSLIDLSAATPATQNAVGEANHDDQLKQTALAQMLGILNMSKPSLPPLQREAIEQLQIEGIAVAIEFLAQKCGGEDNEWVKLLRAQIVEESARHIKSAEEAAATDAKSINAPLADSPETDGVLHVSVGYAPVATKSNAGAIRTALLTGFVQLSQQYPDSVIEPTIARVALQWIPTDEGDDDEGDEPNPA